MSQSSLSAKIFHSLRNSHWKLHRSICDHLTGRNATVSGTASFVDVTVAASHEGEKSHVHHPEQQDKGNNTCGITGCEPPRDVIVPCLDYLEEVVVQWREAGAQLGKSASSGSGVNPNASDRATKRYRYTLEDDSICQYNLVPSPSNTSSTRPLSSNYPQQPSLVEEKMFTLSFLESHSTPHSTTTTTTLSGGGKKLAASGEHLCGKDLYHVKYTFATAAREEVEEAKLEESEAGVGHLFERFQVGYKVKGPAKDYETHTSFIRCEEAASGH